MISFLSFIVSLAERYNFLIARMFILHFIAFHVFSYFCLKRCLLLSLSSVEQSSAVTVHTSFQRVCSNVQVCCLKDDSADNETAVELRGKLSMCEEQEGCEVFRRNLSVWQTASCMYYSVACTFSLYYLQAVTPCRECNKWQV